MALVYRLRNLEHPEIQWFYEILDMIPESDFITRNRIKKFIEERT